MVDGNLAMGNSLEIDAPEEVNNKKDKYCTWTQEFEDGYWESDCNYNFWFEDKTPIENGMKFCCSCGKKLIIKDIKEDE